MLARYGSWGAVPEVFDLRKENWAAERAELKELLGERAYEAAAMTTINAHFTDPAYVREIWAGLERLGFDGGRVLEPAFMRKSGVSRDIRWNSLEHFGLTA